jgi:hypothetical protein
MASQRTASREARIAARSTSEARRSRYGRVEVERLDAPGRRGRGRRLPDFGRHRLVGLRRSASPESRLDLESVVCPGVVAGRDRDPRGEAEPTDVPGDGGRGDRTVRDEYVHTGARELLGRRAREFGGEEARVVTRGDAKGRRGARRSEPASGGPRNRADLFERAVFRDPASPAVGAEVQAQGAVDASAVSRSGV